MKEILFQLSGTGQLKNIVDNYWRYETDTDFIVLLEEKHGCWLVSVDLKQTFNKTSQMPIHFVCEDEHGLSRRKMNRVYESLNFLKRNSTDAGRYFGSMPGFDDLSSEIRNNFYK